MFKYQLFSNVLKEQKQNSKGFWTSAVQKPIVAESIGRNKQTIQCFWPPDLQQLWVFVRVEQTNTRVQKRIDIVEF